MCRSAAWLLIVLLSVAGSSSRARAVTIDGLIHNHLKRPNVYAGFAVPTRRTLLENSLLGRRLLRNRRLYGPSPHDCVSELADLKDGFKNIYPEAPDTIKHGESWDDHVVMVHFPELYLCAIRYRINKDLDRIAKRGIRVPPIVQRVDVTTHDFSKYRTYPKPVRFLMGQTRKLILLAYRGYAPAMIDLVRLSQRSTVIRLTPRFKYFLLRSAANSGLRDRIIDHLFPIVEKELSDETRSEVADWAKLGRWPRLQRMVLD